jgi:predicted nucleotidyltransferase
MESVTTFRATARERARQAAQMREQRRMQAWALARAAAAFLKAQYGATRVVVFGSLTDRERFHFHSDVDLAVWGLQPESYFEAVARVLDIGNEIEIDLTMAERCKPHLQEAIERGVEVG